MSARTDPLRFRVRAKPGARVSRVGGRWGTGDSLVVAVTAPAVNNQANRAVIALLAATLDVPKSDLGVVSGSTGRTKLIEWTNPPHDAALRLAALLDG